MNTADQVPQYLIEANVAIRPPAIEGSSLISRDFHGERQISVRVKQPAAEWVRSAVSRIEELTALAPGWDGYRANAIDATVAVQAVRFVMDHAYPTLPEPAIVPTGDGGIQIEWHRGGVDFEITISDRESSLFLEDHETGEVDERPADEANAMFSDILGRLARG